ncbi:MAG TPA: shikimate kinase [Rhizomicrobium sp.]|jgi:shikimate kinase|nr:shikimate kinase [Rhizomicrobium sp.]
MALDRTVALVGMMGAGKTSVGRRLAQRLAVPFRDADHEIEAAAGLTVAEIFERFGESHFRDGERKVIARLLHEPPHVLATGGGAFMDESTRDAMAQSAFTIWLKAPLHLLMARVKKRETRPLLKEGDMRATLEKLLAVREPVYAKADMMLDSADEPHGAAVERIVEALRARGLYGDA